MKNIFIEKARFPKFLIIIYWIQFTFFSLYYFKKMEYSLLIFLIGLFLLGIFLSFSYTKLKISKGYIEFGLIPITKNIISWNDVKEFEIVKISAISDFLGWGIRYSKKYGWSYIMRGEYAICFTLNSGKKKTISLINHGKLRKILDNIG